MDTHKNAPPTPKGREPSGWRLEQDRGGPTIARALETLLFEIIGRCAIIRGCAFHYSEMRVR